MKLFPNAVSALGAIIIGIAAVDYASGEHIATCKDGGTGMISTADPTATQVGLQILEEGGTAVDAMVAVQAVLGLVEPQSSGIGGGSFAVYYDSSTSSVTTFDGRETAPATATEDRFAAFPPGLMGFVGAWQSGLSVGVPGTPLLLETMLEKYGTKSMRDLFQPAIDLATNGFPMSGRTYGSASFLFGLVNQGSCSQRLFFRDPKAFEYMVSGDNETCEVKSPGTNLTNPDYAATLETIASMGAKEGFYTGDIANAIAAAVQSDLGIPGDMVLADLESYQVIEREPVCVDFGMDSICGMGPPSSGGLAVGQMLALLEQVQDKLVKDDTSVDNATMVLDPTNVHLFTQAGRLAFADRNQFVGDPDFASVPSEGMLNKDYLAERALLINATSDMGTASPGNPPGSEGMQMAMDTSVKNTGTTHISIVDSYGNAVSLTSSIEAPFGNGVMVNGFFLNNELTDFSFSASDASGNPIANRVQGGKRPRSSMSPTIVMNNEGGTPKLLSGSPGGGNIIAYTAQSLWNVLEFGLNPQAAINVPHYMNNNGGTTLEDPTSAEGLMDYDVETLKTTLETEFGHAAVSIADDLTSGLAVIVVEDEYWVGGADPRRGGAVGPSIGTDCADDGMVTPSPNADGMTSSPPSTSPNTDSTPPPGDAEASEANSIVVGLCRQSALLALLLACSLA